MNLSHRHYTYAWHTSDDKKVLLTYEFEFETPENVWVPAEYDLFYLVQSTTPESFRPVVFESYGIDLAKFEELITTDVSEFSKLVSDNIEVFNRKLEPHQSVVKNINVTATISKFYDREKHEYEDI